MYKIPIISSSLRLFSSMICRSSYSSCIHSIYESDMERGGESHIREKSFFDIIVTLRKRKAGRRGRDNGCVWQSWQGYHLRVCRDLHFTLMFSVRLQKDLFKGRWNLAEGFYKQNYCHVCPTTFGVFFSLSSCCVSSLIWTRGRALIRAWALIRGNKV